MDATLPGASGPELQRLLGARNNSTPLVFVTGYDDAELKAGVIAAGASIACVSRTRKKSSWHVSRRQSPLESSQASERSRDRLLSARLLQLLLAAKRDGSAMQSVGGPSGGSPVLQVAGLGAKARGASEVSAIFRWTIRSSPWVSLISPT